MTNFNGQKITKLMDMQGKRIGALVGKTILNKEGILKLSRYLKQTGQQLANATVTADGRILSKTGHIVQEWIYSDTVLDDFVRNDTAYVAPDGYAWTTNNRINGWWSI